MVNEIAGAIKEGFKFFADWNKSRDKRRMQACIEAGEKYIQTNENPKLTIAKKNKLLLHYRKRFFHYN